MCERLLCARDEDAARAARGRKLILRVSLRVEMENLFRFLLRVRRFQLAMGLHVFVAQEFQIRVYTFIYFNHFCPGWPHNISISRIRALGGGDTRTCFKWRFMAHVCGVELSR